MANTAREMADNQAVLEAEREQVERDRDYEERLSGALTAKRLGSAFCPPQLPPRIHPRSDDVQINIDSPTTVNRVYPSQRAQEQAGRAKSLAAKALPYILSAALGGGGATGALLPWLLSKTPDPPTVTDTDTTRRIEIDKWVPEPEG